jgi:16S rRNA (cytosine967-C5)-methyltransferase
MHPKTVARRAALRALVAIEREDKPINAALETVEALRVPPETRPFARELVAGTMRHRALLDWTLQPFLKKPLAKLDAPVRAALRLAAYESTLLSTPAPVIANEYAGLMRSEKLSSAVAFVNAIVRRLPAMPRPAPDIKKYAAQHLATQYSHPQWLVERWLARFGLEQCRQLLERNNQIAPLNLRVNTLRTSREAVLETLQSRGLQAQPSTLSPVGIVVEAAGSPLDWPEWRDGLIIAQDEAAQLVALLASPQVGQTVYDVASAPGGKTTHLAQLMNDEGQVFASDRAAGRLKLVTENAQRLGLKSIQTREGDVELLASQNLVGADVVLLDAPCLGTGTLRRRPDAKWRKTSEQLHELNELQCQLLDAAATLVKPEGVLVYSTCSLEPEENEVQIVAFLERHPNWQLVDAQASSLPQSTLEQVQTDAGFIQTLPQLHGTTPQGCDGMFAAKLRRNGA